MTRTLAALLAAGALACVITGPASATTNDTPPVSVGATVGGAEPDIALTAAQGAAVGSLVGGAGSLCCIVR